MKIVKNLLWCIPLIISVFIFLLLPMFPEFTEYVFSRGIFRIITVPLGFLFSLIPISFTELLVVIAVPTVILLIVLLILKLRKSPNKLKTAGKAARATAWFLSCTVLLYMINHGANFYRLTAAELMGLDTSTKSPEFLKAVCIELASGAAAARAECKSDENGVMVFDADIYEELSRAENGYSKLYEEYPFLWGTVSRGKNVLLSHYWSYTGTCGMYFPFFCESNINTDQPHCDIPSTVAHELAHTRGFAREDECNFFSFLACINSDYPEYRYSGYILAYCYCADALYSYDKDAWREAYSLLTEDIHRDIAASSDYWVSFEGEISEISSSVNNSFIQAQGVEDGTLSYGKMAELVLAYYDKMMYNS